MTRVLVTGASGFIGRHLIARLLRHGCRVRALLHVQAGPADWPEGVELLWGDIREAGAMKAATAACDTVFHLAGKAHALPERDEDEAEYHALNVEGTRHVLDAAVAGGVRRFVFFSSVKAMGEEARECRDESWPPAPLTAYGRSKLAAERLVFDYGQRSGLGATCLRLPLVYGPGVKGNLLRMIEAIDRGFFPPFPALHNRRSLVHVANVVEAAVLAGASPSAQGRCYLVTDARPYSTRELYELICRALGKRVPRWSVPVGVLTAAARAGDFLGQVTGRRLPLDSDVLGTLTGSAWYDSARITCELGYRPVASLEEALPAMVAWYREARV